MRRTGSERVQDDGGCRSTSATVRRRPSPNVLDRRFEAPAPNRKWVADFTYIWTGEGWLYVAAVLDLFSRRVVGWSMSAAMTAELVTDALVMAIWRRGRPESFCIIPIAAASIRASIPAADGRARGGMQHQSLRQRLGQRGDGELLLLAQDRALARKVYRTRDQARADVFDYIERFYNPRRRHSTIGYLSPMQFEQRMRLA